MSVIVSRAPRTCATDRRCTGASSTAHEAGMQRTGRSRSPHASSATSWPVPPARRHCDLRHAGTARSAVLDALPASSTARATSGTSTTTPRPRCGTPSRACPDRDRAAARHRRGQVDFQPNYDESAASRPSSRLASRTCSSTARPASPRRRRTSLRTTSARSSTPWSR